MVNPRTLFLIPFFILLAGCLQIELLGPVVGAKVTISELRSGVTAVNGLTTEDEASLRATRGNSKWEKWSEAIRLDFLGTVEVPADELDDDTLYLVSATGGLDIDNNADGVIDVNGTPVDRGLHAIMTGTQLKEPINRVSLLSEAIYQALIGEVADLSDAELLAQLIKPAKAWSAMSTMMAVKTTPTSSPGRAA